MLCVALRQPMTSPRLGFILLLLAWAVPRLPGGDSPAIAPAEKESATTPLPDEPPTAKNTPAVNTPANPVPSGSGDESDEAKSRSILRSALHESFPYDPSARTKRPEQSSVDQAAQGTDDSEIVVLPDVEVTSRVLDRGLTAAIANQKPTGPQNHSKFGTGIHEKDFGKVRASVITILYIPVGFGLSW